MLYVKLINPGNVKAYKKVKFPVVFCYFYVLIGREIILFSFAKILTEA
jgi:hypothetical protein